MNAMQLIMQWLSNNQYRAKKINKMKVSHKSIFIEYINCMLPNLNNIIEGVLIACSISWLKGWIAFKRKKKKNNELLVCVEQWTVWTILL